MRQLNSEDFRYDQLAILIFARMYHIQIKIVTSKGSWITSKRQPKEPFDIVLAFFGQNVFHDTKLSTSVEYIPSIPSGVNRGNQGRSGNRSTIACAWKPYLNTGFKS